MDCVQSVTLARGLKLGYVDKGGPGGVPVVLLHGYSDSWRSYAGLMGLLPRVDRVVALSLRGHGESDKPDHGYDASTMAADVSQAMDRLGIDSAVVVGHSMGSQVALRLAIGKPSRVRGLVLLGAFATLAGTPAAAELGAAVATLGDPVDPGFVREFQCSTLAQPIDAAVLETMVNTSLQMPARVWQAVGRPMLREDLTPRLGEVAAPTLILWGDRDAICDRASQEALRDGIPGAELVIYPNVGHAIHWERPREVASDIARFVGHVAAGGHRQQRRAAG